MKRRDSLKLIALSSLAAGLPGCTVADVDKAASKTAALSPDVLASRTPTALSAHEYRTVEILVDYIIPEDERSGSATAARVPAFIDFILDDTEGLKTPFRGGLGWLDYACQTRFQKAFSDLSEENQRTILDTVAWPDTADATEETGVRFFNLLRNLTASGFWSSRMGVEDLGYAGNSPQTSWKGCPDVAMQYLGVEYDDA